MIEQRPASPSVTIEARSSHPADGFDRVAIVPTFRRPEGLLRTLASLAAQETSRPLAVIVMENDAAGREGLSAARALFETGALAGLVLVAHDRGNCSAYNAGVRTALREFPAMRHCLVIDDDEAAAPDWAERMAGTLERLEVDVVGGPQVPVFEGGAPAALARHPVFRPPFRRTGRVPMLYSSGNLCASRALLERMGDPLFDTAFNFTGGGDSDFFSRAALRGARFGWCAEAPVSESVPARRTQWSWIHARALRNGALSSAIQRRRQGRWRSGLKTAALLAAAPPRAVLQAVLQRSVLIGLYPIQVALGRLQGEFGRIGEQYREPEAN
ncbi:glycosyltransferase family 2 protein [Aureimonas flava]|uniref:Glycosyltransferase family 2 protein n=1 Tax=Aureimonas flava TaxID=2320271 RepID=A0A3A1WHF8_9HYPH|nr:glycosyltransferase family 2 protein [Aureimonas flava]RIY00043.1 glycosyltransferase family 2 protein [Aureimonas flava]